MTSQQPSDEQYVEMMREILLADPIRGVPTQPTRLLDNLFIGSQSNAESLKLLRELHVTHVLNCAGYKGPRPSPDASPYEGLGIDYYEFQAEDTDRYDISRHFPEAFTYLDKVRRQRGVALVHCALGINRSAAVCVAYMMVHARMPLLEATRVIKSKRRVVLANKYFQKLLVRYARSKGLLDNIRVKVEKVSDAPPLSPSRDSSEYSACDYNLGNSRNRYDRENRAFNGRDEVDIPTFNSHDYVSGSDIYGRSVVNGDPSGRPPRDSQRSNGHTRTRYSDLSNGSSHQRNGDVSESSSSYRSATPSSSNGSNNSGRLNNLYRDLFERFDRLTESLTSNGRSPFGRRTQSSTALPPQSDRTERPASRQDGALSQSMRYKSNARPSSQYGNSAAGAGYSSTTLPRWAMTSSLSSTTNGGDATPLLTRHGSVRQRPSSAIPWSDTGSGNRSRSVASTYRTSYGSDTNRNPTDVALGRRPSNCEFIYAI